MRFFIDWLPIILFFLVFKYSDIFYATGAAMVASIILIGALKLFNKPVEKVQWAGLIMIVLFGGLTIILRDEQFINCLLYTSPSPRD